MGTLAKRLGQLQAVFQKRQVVQHPLWKATVAADGSHERTQALTRDSKQRAQGSNEESRNILRTGAANKLPGSLSLALDGTLKQGHDMRTFGLGTAASLASRQRYARFTAAMHAVYSTMEEELDATAAAASPAVYSVWSRHGDTLRRAPALKLDLSDVADATSTTPSLPASAATERYVASLRRAGASDRASGGGRLLGHLYCRYFADLFGGQMLAGPTRLALALPAETPRHYHFEKLSLGGEGARRGRRAFIEDVYRSLNEAGEMLPAEGREKVADEASHAFRCNIDVYSEEPIYVDSLRGILNICTGYVGSRFQRA